MWNIQFLSSKNTGGIFEVAKLMIAFFGHDLARADGIQQMVAGMIK